ncbi:hypothetical protein SGFS_045660 [Streptomyces graminofaciens]|uniref:Uncharacterized protein n=1 Tax=Streptomyces graminofaciens TaxID=68212 RepID=A0ABN5VMA7_9ACTN|nr:hypothetical protein [Streptomyces graminofaciens]BBC33272.1 hypothetical protein SGFS_045660 [Streptomyces graminofaciens]
MKKPSTRRRPIRMCARCQRMTSTPVVVHEEHAATGPGFTVYACPECAEHYPPPADALEPLDPAPRQSRMTIRVYKATSDNSTTQDRAEVHVCTGSRIDPTPQSAAFPPCTCPRCREARQS